MERDPEIEALLNAARVAAINDVEGMPATRAILELAGARARDHVLVQADLGMWRKWSITSGQDIKDMKCTFELRAAGLVAATAGASREPIVVRWDFKHTPLWFLETH